MLPSERRETLLDEIRGDCRATISGCRDVHVDPAILKMQSRETGKFEEFQNTRDKWTDLNLIEKMHADSRRNPWSAYPDSSWVIASVSSQ